MTRSREEQLVDVARWALRYFRHETFGQEDDLHIGRELARVLAGYDDIEPTHDADRREWRQRVEQQHALVRS